jgi:hypothetical protein
MIFAREPLGKLPHIPKHGLVRPIRRYYGSHARHFGFLWKGRPVSRPTPGQRSAPARDHQSSDFRAVCLIDVAQLFKPEASRASEAAPLCWPVAVVVVRRELIDKFIHKVLVLAADKPQRVHVSAHCLLASYLTIRTNELLTASTIKKCSVA